MQVTIISLFPEMLSALTEFGITGRAVQAGVLNVRCVNPRDFTDDVHRTVDDRPYGGGPGMVMRVTPLRKAVRSAREGLPSARVICLSPQGRAFVQADAERLALCDAVIMVCGRYEGIDERFLDTDVDEELSIGDYVLSGGELGAMVVIDATARHIPGVIGNANSVTADSFSNGLLDCPHYTRPEEVDGQRVPEALLSGDHERIRRWRLQQALGRTWERRPELLHGRQLSGEQQDLLREYRNDRDPGSDN